MKMIITIYLIGLVPVFIFIWYSLANVGIYWYQFNRLECIKGWIGVIFWPALPLFIWLNERRLKKYLRLPFEERMRLEGRIPEEFTNRDGTKYVAYVLKDKNDTN